MKYSFLYYSDVFYKINFAILYLYNLISGGYLFFMRFLRTKYGYPYFLRRRKAIHGTRYCYSTMCSCSCSWCRCERIYLLQTGYKLSQKDSRSCCRLCGKRKRSVSLTTQRKNAETLKKRGIDRGERRDPQVTPGNGKRA